MTAYPGVPRTESTHHRLIDFAKTTLTKIFLFPYATVCELYCGQVPDVEKFDEALIGHYIGIDVGTSGISQVREAWESQRKSYTSDFFELDPCTLLLLPNMDPGTCQSGMSFLRRLTGLESLEIEFPTPDDLYHLDLWFRWFGETQIVMQLERHFFIAVNATLIPHDGQQIDDNEDDDWVSMDPSPKQCHEACRRFIFHYFAGWQRYYEWPSPKLRTVVSKDFRDYGRKRVIFQQHKYSLSNIDRPRNRSTLYYLPTTLALNNDASTRIKDALLLCTSWGDIGADLGRTICDFIMDNLDNGQESELAEVVRKILLHHKTLVVIEDL